MSQNNIKGNRYTWGAKVFIVLVSFGCAASIYALVQVIMEGL